MSARGRAAVVFAAAPLEPTQRLKSRLSSPDRPFIVAADGGARTALAFGLEPDVVIGDHDSLPAETVHQLQLKGITIETYPRDKDATDGQLAIERALRPEPCELLLLGFLGGPRLDQAVANVLLLQAVDVPAVLLDERNECVLVRPGAEHTWRPEPREIVSLLPMASDVAGVRTAGLRWALSGEPLRFGDTRGVSNEPVADQASVSIQSGLLLVTRHFPD